jgi:ABC-type dipeptide/oligopeptide/nickel transport system permease component
MSGLSTNYILIIFKVLLVPAIVTIIVWSAFGISGGEIMAAYAGPGILDWLAKVYFKLDFGLAGNWALSGQPVSPYLWQAVLTTGVITVLAIILLLFASLSWSYLSWRSPFNPWVRSGSVMIRFFSSWPVLIGAIILAVVSKSQAFASILLPAIVLAICDNNFNDFKDNLNDEINKVLNSDYAVAMIGQGKSFLKNLGPELSWKILSFIGSRLPALVSGIIVLEIYFNINGIYTRLKMFYEMRDLNAILGITFIVSLLLTVWSSLFSIIHSLIDPRQR